MMQGRPKEGENSKWYAPDRDLAYVGKGLLKLAILHLQEEVEPDTPLEAAFCRDATALGKLVVGIANQTVSEEELKNVLAKLDPQVRARLADHFLCSVLEKFRYWAREVPLPTGQQD